MRAVVLREFGPPEALVAAEVPDPVPGQGQALVEVEIANITFVETQLRAGRAPNPAMAPQLPAILGNGVGGVVASVGPGVDPALVSSRVITSTGGSGGYAERVAVDAAGLIAVPDELEMAEAVALLADGRTALSLVRAAAPRPGETVLVEAAAGGVGSLLVQLARAAGASVAAAAGGERKLRVAADLGASATVDYTEPGWAERLREQLGGVDVAFDGVGGEAGRAAFELVRAGGRFCPFGMASGAFARIPEGEAERRNVTVVRGGPMPLEETRALARACLAEAVAGRLRPVIGQRFPLDRAADAHAAIEARATIGKTLLVVDGQRQRRVPVPGPRRLGRQGCAPAGRAGRARALDPGHRRRRERPARPARAFAGTRCARRRAHGVVRPAARDRRQRADHREPGASRRRSPRARDHRGRLATPVRADRRSPGRDRVGGLTASVDQGLEADDHRPDGGVHHPDQQRR